MQHCTIHFASRNGCKLEAALHMRIHIHPLPKNVSEAGVSPLTQPPHPMKRSFVAVCFILHVQYLYMVCCVWCLCVGGLESKHLQQQFSFQVDVEVKRGAICMYVVGRFYFNQHTNTNIHAKTTGFVVSYSTVVAVHLIYILPSGI